MEKTCDDTDSDDDSFSSSSSLSSLGPPFTPKLSDANSHGKGFNQDYSVIRLGYPRTIHRSDKAVTPFETCIDNAIRANHELSQQIERLKVSGNSSERSNEVHYSIQERATPLLCAELSKQLQRIALNWSGAPGKISETMAGYVIADHMIDVAHDEAHRVEHNMATNGYDLLFIPLDKEKRCQFHEVKSTVSVGQCAVNFKLPEPIKRPEGLALLTTKSKPDRLKNARSDKKKFVEDIVTYYLCDEETKREKKAQKQHQLFAPWASEIVASIEEWGRSLMLARPPFPFQDLAEDSDDRDKRLLMGTDDGNVIVMFDDPAAHSVLNVWSMDLFGPLIVGYLALHYMTDGKIAINLGSKVCDKKKCGKPHRLAIFERESIIFRKEYKEKCVARKTHFLSLRDTILLYGEERWQKLFERFNKCIKC